jgi:hypothetical protein
MADNDLDLPELDRLLRQELSVEPSPAFLPRVRARVEADRAASAGPGASWRLTAWLPGGWRPLLATAAVVLLLAAGTLLRQTGPGSPQAVPAAPERTVAAAPPPGKVERPSPSTVAGAATAPFRQPGRAAVLFPQRPRTGLAAAPEAAVIVDQRQRVGIERLMDLTRSGSLTDASFVPAPDGSVEEVTVAPIPVDLLTVSPIPVGGVLQKGTPFN